MCLLQYINGNTQSLLCFVVAWTVRKNEKPGELCENNMEKEKVVTQECKKPFRDFNIHDLVSIIIFSCWFCLVSMCVFPSCLIPCLRFQETNCLKGQKKSISVYKSWASDKTTHYTLSLSILSLLCRFFLWTGLDSGPGHS